MLLGPISRKKDVIAQWWSEKKEENKIEEKRRKMNQGSLISLSHLELLEKEKKSKVLSHHVLFLHLSNTSYLVGRLSENSHSETAATSSV